MYNAVNPPPRHGEKAVSRKLSPEFRLQAYATKELVESWELRATGICFGRKLKGRKLKPGPLMDALILWFMGLDKGEQDRIVNQALPMLEDHLDRPDDPVAPPAAAQPGAVPVVNSAPERKARG